MVIELSVWHLKPGLRYCGFSHDHPDFEQIGGNPIMHDMMSTFSGQLWFRKKRLSSLTSKHAGSVFLEQEPLTFIVRSQDMRKLYPCGDAYRHFFFILLNYFQDYCVNELNILPLRFYCFHLSRWIRIAFYIQLV